MLIYHIVDSEILKIHSKIFSVSSLVKYRSRDHCFQNGDVCKSSEPIFTFVQRKNYMFVSKKIEILQENNKSMYRYCFSLNSMCIEIKPSSYHY